MKLYVITYTKTKKMSNWKEIAKEFLNCNPKFELTIIGVLVLAFVVSLTFIGCKSEDPLQKSSVEYVRERHMWETTDIICDSAVYKYTFIGCMESNKVGWDQDESACRAYAIAEACKLKEK